MKKGTTQTNDKARTQGAPSTAGSEKNKNKNTSGKAANNQPAKDEAKSANSGKTQTLGNKGKGSTNSRKDGEKSQSPSKPSKGTTVPNKGQSGKGSQTKESNKGVDKGTDTKGSKTQDVGGTSKQPQKGNKDAKSGTPQPKKVDPFQSFERSARISRFVTYQQAQSVCRYDSNIVANGDATFVSANSFQYFVAINTWCTLIEDICGKLIATTISRYIRRWGLLQVIDEASQTANEMLRALAAEDDGWMTNSLAQLLIGDGEIEVDQLLEVCRFLKRFTVSNACKLRETTEKKFLECLARTNWRKEVKRVYDEYIDRDPLPAIPRSPYVVSIRKFFKQLFPEKKFKKFLAEAPIKFSNGVCSDGKNLRDKLRVLGKQQASIELGMNYPIGLGDTPYEKYSQPEVTVTTVPKNYKTYRTIAPESVYVAVHMQRVLYALEKCMRQSKFHHMFDVHDQEPNRHKAFLGSIDDEAWVTYDLTSASDSIARHYMHDFLPDWVWEAISPFLATAIIVGGKKYAPSIFLTSGNPCTFILEGALFVGLCLEARAIHMVFCPDEAFPDDPQVFGDDILVPYAYSEEVQNILEQHNFIVNIDKSFTSGHYRESCGVEYYYGYPTHSDYWPRKEVSKRDGIERVVATLCDLQHRLFRYTTLRTYLEEMVLELYPKMTYSLVGSDSFDLWSQLPVNAMVCAPFGPVRNPKKGSLALQEPTATTLLTKYTPDVVGRSRHVVLKQKGELKLQQSDAERLEVYLYYQYLSHGPQFADKLSELLNVSDPPARHAVLTDDVVLTTALGD